MNVLNLFKTTFYSAVLAVLSVGIAVPESNVKAASSVAYECEIDPEKLQEINTVAGFKAYLASIGVPYEKYVAKAGATLTVNKNFAADRCLIVYGSPSSVKTDGRKKQSLGENGEYKYLGYDQNGNQFSNPEYPDYKAGVNYVKVRPFYKYPWSNSELNTYIATDENKPYTVNPNATNAPKPTYIDPTLGRVRTKAEELDRAIDRMYLANCGSSCGLGKRGNFTQTNTALGLKLVGSNLVNYASVNNYPNAYVAGTFDLYYKSTTTGNTWFSTFYLPPYIQVLGEKRDLAVSITSLPTSIIEDQSFTTQYKVCNNGEISVSNPVIHYGEISTTSKTTTLNITLNPGDCYTGSLNDKANSVSLNSSQTYQVTVNKDGKNPSKENVTSNNTATKTFTVLNNAINGSIKIKTQSPENPSSNQETTFAIEVCNHSLTPVNNVVAKYGFKGEATSSKTISNIAAGACTTFEVSQKAPIIEKNTGNATFEAMLDSFTNDSNSSDDNAAKAITIKNPDAKIEIISSTDATTSGISDIKVKVTNNMFANITNTCGSSSATLPCVEVGTGRPGKTRVNIYDTKLTADKSDDVLIQSASMMPTFSLASGQSTVFTISKSHLENHIKEHYQAKYQLVQFRVATEIPHFAGEVDYFGNESYKNNREEDYIIYYPERPSIAATRCNYLEHAKASYFTTNGTNPIKICMGHFPTYPSTTVEGGMQAYHFVLYRFFPTPLPKYTVTTFEEDSTNPNHFSQLFELPSTEDSDQMGDVETMFFTGVVDGYYQERGRYMPTGGVFDFKVYKNGKEGEPIALGSVSYDIPTGCYKHDTLDIRHLYGCDEILFFLPNYNDESAKHEKPEDYSKEDIIYPIEGTKIPYLNPGKYTFKFDATETFKYYYQTNARPYYKSTTTADGKTTGYWVYGYEWSEPKFK